MDEMPQQIPGQQPMAPQEPAPPIQSQPNQVTPPNLPSTGSNNSNFSIVSVVIIVIALSVYIALAYQMNLWPFSLDVMDTESSSPTPTVDATANWKTYTDTQYSYEVKYPPTWSVQGSVFTNSNNSSEVIRISVDPFNPDNLTLDAWLRVQDWPSKEPIETQFLSIGRIDGVDAVEQQTTGTIFFTKGANVFSIENGISFDRAVVPSEVFNRFLSTFKFIMPGTANWHFYKNEVFDFEFSFPKNLEIVSDATGPYPGGDFQFTGGVSISGTDFSGFVGCNNPGTGAIRIYQPQPFSAKTADMKNIQGRFGLILPFGETQPSEEWHWEGSFDLSPLGDSCYFGFSSSNDLNITSELVKQILSTFRFR